MRSAFEDEGDVRGVDLLAGFVSIWRRDESGTLHFSRPGATARFDLHEAEIVATGSSDPRYETAAILVRAGKLSGESLEKLPAPAGSDRALAALQAGLLTRREWRWGEKIRAIEVLSDLLTWLDGSYVFDREARPGAADFSLSVPRLILELFLRSRDRTLIHHYLGQADAPLVRAEGFDDEFASFGLTADAESVVRLIDGESSAEEICAKAPADSFAVEKLLAALITLGLLRPAHALAEAGRVPEPRPMPGTEPEPFAAGEIALPDEPPAQPAEDAFEHKEPIPESPPKEEPAPLPELEEGRPEEAGSESPVSGWESLAPEPLDRTLEMPSEIEPSRPNRSAAPLLWVLGLLLAAVAAVLFLRSRENQEEAAAPAKRTAVPMPPAAEPTAPPPAEAPVAAPPAILPREPVPRLPTPLPTARPTALSLSPRERVGERREQPTGEASEREKWLRRAARDERRARRDRRTRNTIQLELVCEIDSVREAFQYDRPGGTMWLLASPHAGRTCFRVLWGRYPTLEAARRAKARIPSFFTTPRNRPAVVGVRESLLP